MLNDNRSKVPIVDENGKERGTNTFHPSVAEHFAHEIVEKFAPDDAEVKRIVKQFPKTADQIPHLKKWLRSRIEKSKD